MAITGDKTKAQIAADTVLGQQFIKSLHRQSQRAIQAAEEFSPSASGDWVSAPSTQDAAIDALASTKKSRQVEATWEVADGATGAVDLGVSIPAGAVIISVIQDVQEEEAGSTEALLSIDSNDISDDLVGAAVGVSASSATLPVKTSSAGSLTFTIAGTSTTGKISFLVEYYVPTSI